MKKLCLLLTLVLALSAVPAFAAEGDVQLGRDGDTSIFFRDAFTDGETLYLNAYDTLYSWHKGDADLTKRTLNVPDAKVGDSFETFPFCSDGQLYALVFRTAYTGDGDSEFTGAKLYTLIPGEGDAFDMEERCDVDWDDMVEYYGQSSYATTPDSVLGIGSVAVFRCYDMSGSYNLYAINLESGAIEEAGLRDIYSMTPYRDGSLLVEQYNYEDATTARLAVYYPDDGYVEPLAQLEIESYSPLAGLCYDEETDTLYCVKAGEICPVDVREGVVGEGVTDMPLEQYSGAACLLPGGYYAFCSEGVVIRNLDPGQKASIRLKINDSSYNDCMNTAYTRFANAHGDVSVVLSHDWNENQKLLENMMNHESNIDIYILTTSTNVYDALYWRGYLMELDGSEKIKAFADRMYPTLREELSANGRLVALPIDVFCWTIGLNEKALEALGLTLDDVPDNLWDFLDWLPTLEGPLAEHSNVCFCYPGYTDENMRSDLFQAIFNEYQRYVNALEPEMGYNTDLMRGLLQKLEAIDFVALGCPETEEDESDDVRYYRYGDFDNVLPLVETSVGCTIGNFYADYVPLLLKLAPDKERCLTLQTQVAVINPYTRYPDLALEFIEELVDDLSDAARYNLCPDLSEPIRGVQFEQRIEEAKAELEAARQELAEAEPADRQLLEEQVSDFEENVEYLEENAWEVSERAVAWYRAHDDALHIGRLNWLYADDDGEAWTLMQQYTEGAISIDEMLAAIDRKVQMMKLEGN